MPKPRRRHVDIVRGAGRWVERLCPKCNEWKHQDTHYYQRENGQRESICRACQLIKRRAYYVAHHDGAKTSCIEDVAHERQRVVEAHDHEPCCAVAEAGHGPVPVVGMTRAQRREEPREPRAVRARGDLPLQALERGIRRTHRARNLRASAVALKSQQPGVDADG